jgi:ABC-type amino acid transport substrate-binding protein
MNPGRLSVALLVALAACQSHPSEGPLAEEKLEVASAAPGALGALAAGTDAAPQPPVQARVPRRTWQIPGDEMQEEPADPEEGVDGGIEPEGGPELGAPDMKVPL